MTDEFEISVLRNQLDLILDPNYPNRDEILDVFAHHIYHSQKHTNALQDKFMDLYTGPKDKVEEFKILLGASMLLCVGTPPETVKKRINKILDLAEEVEELGRQHGEEDAYSAIPEMKLGGLVQDGISIAVKQVEADNIWEQRIKMGAENLDYSYIQNLPRGINVKIVVSGEAFWCEVLEQMAKGTYLVRVDNDLVMTHLHNLKADDCIVISYKNILEISW